MTITKRPTGLSAVFVTYITLAASMWFPVACSRSAPSHSGSKPAVVDRSSKRFTEPLVPSDVRQNLADVAAKRGGEFCGRQPVPVGVPYLEFELANPHGQS